MSIDTHTETMLRQLLDIEQIKQLKYRYFRGIDTADAALLEDVFTDDASVDLRGGSYRCQFDGKRAILDFLASAFHNESAACHQGHHPEITITGQDSATAIWYLQDIFIDFSRDIVTRGSAFYRDQCVRQNGAWKVHFSEYDRIWEEVERRDPKIKTTVRHLQDRAKPPSDLGIDPASNQ